jgi:diacylglycerol kinase family enzyme
MKVLAIINAHSGTAREHRGEALHALLAILFQARGLDAEIELAQGDAIAKTAARAVEHAKAGELDAVVAGGGDGTIRCVAAALAGSGIPLGVLPLGTRNHFARALNLPLDLEGAVAVIGQRQTAQVDAGEVNGRLFINNASLGLYPFLVLDRERRQSAHGLGKWVAAALASVRMLWRFPIRRLIVSIEGEARPHRTPLLFVGNNRYDLRLPEFGERDHLNRGELWICISKSESRIGLIGLALRTVLGLGDPARDLETHNAHSAEIRSHSSRLPIAYDGEVEIMRQPLRFRTRPRALTVLVPFVGESESSTPAARAAGVKI